MGKCFLYGNGGGGSSKYGLQFVSGSTEPANPSEDMIWVKSSIAGNKCVVSISEPESPKEGLVWFEPGEYGLPTVCRVYTGSAWEPANVLIFSNSAWQLMNWDNIVYPNTYSDKVTGGFEYGSSSTVMSFSDKDEYLYATVIATSGKTAKSEQISKNTVNVTKNNTLKFIATITISTSLSSNGVNSLSALSVRLMDADNKAVASSTECKATKVGSTSSIPDAKQTYSIDISEISGNYYLDYMLQVISNTGSTTGTIKIYKIWLE